MRRGLALALLASTLGVNAAPCVPKVVRVQLDGDSTQLGLTGAAPGRPAERLKIGPGELLQSAMNARFGAGAVQVIQQGAGGARARGAPLGVLDRINVFVSRLGVTVTPVDITVANFGINDMRDGVSIEDYKAALKARRVTIFETPSPVVGATDAYAVAMRQVAGSKPIADVDAYVRSLPNWQRLTPDGIHPNAELYAMISANVLVPVVVPLIAELRCESHQAISAKIP